MKIVNQIIYDEWCEYFTIDKFLMKENKKPKLMKSVSFYRSELCESFENYWWSFVQSLGACLRNADHINAKKLIETFQDYVVEYAFDFIKEDQKNA